MKLESARALKAEALERISDPMRPSSSPAPTSAAAATWG